MELQALQQECLACRRCGLCEMRHSVVFGQGAAHAEVMLVGEGPGANEDEQGLPFVGKSRPAAGPLSGGRRLEP